MTRCCYTRSPMIEEIQLSKYYHIRLPDVAEKLGTSMYHLRTMMRKIGVRKWPYPKFQRLTALRSDLHSPISLLTCREYDNLIQILRANPNMSIRLLVCFYSPEISKTCKNTMALVIAAREALEDLENPKTWENNSVTGTLPKVL